MTNTITRRDVPADQVDKVAKLFTDDGCTVKKEEQDDGKWTIVATCPETGPEGTEKPI